MTNLQTGIMSAVLGGLLSGGVMMLTNRTPKAEAVAPPPAAAALATPMPVPLNAPEVTIPGYRGLLYDQARRIVGVSVQPVQAAAGRPLPAPPARSFAAPAPARTAPVRTARVQKKGRSKKMSTAIIAGSAGTGAAIGAIAGGGKGAAIGAISGGAAGVIYDRTTANKQKN